MNVLCFTNVSWKAVLILCAFLLGSMGANVKEILGSSLSSSLLHLTATLGLASQKRPVERPADAYSFDACHLFVMQIAHCNASILMPVTAKC